MDTDLADLTDFSRRYESQFAGYCTNGLGSGLFQIMRSVILICRLYFRLPIPFIYCMILLILTLQS